MQSTAGTGVSAQLVGTCKDFSQSESDVRTEGTFSDGLRIADRACRPYAFALGLSFSRSVSVWLHTIRMPASFCSMEAIPVAHEETCETCKCRIVGVRNHRRGTFVDLCSAHFEMLAEHERAAYGAVESMPFRSGLATPCPAHARVNVHRCCHQARHRAGSGGGDLGRAARARLGLERCVLVDQHRRARFFLKPTEFGSQALQLDPALSRGRGCSQRSRTACRQACA